MQNVPLCRYKVLILAYARTITKRQKVKTILRLIYRDNLTAVSAFCITLPLFIAKYPASQSKRVVDDSRRHRSVSLAHQAISGLSMFICKS